VIALLVILGSWLVLRRTVLGVHIYAVGGNESAARLAGIKVWAVLIFVYGVSGLLAGLGGAMQAAPSMLPMGCSSVSPTSSTRSPLLSWVAPPSSAVSVRSGERWSGP